MVRSPHRFHYSGSLGSDDAPEDRIITLPAKESHHLANVLRLGAGEEVVVFDDEGKAWKGEVVSAEGRGAGIRLTDRADDQTTLFPGTESTPPHPMESPRLHLAVCVLKHRAMDWMIEKLCELDVATLQPLISRRTIVKPKSPEGNDQIERWERITLAAAKQAGRNLPLRIMPVIHIDDWLKQERPRTLGCFANKGEHSAGLGEWLGGRAGMGLPVQAAVGPEGGWTPEEVEGFLKANFTEVSLGPLVLRAETAAITVAAACRVMMMGH